MEDNDDVLVRRARARLGKTVKDKWRLERLIGVGGMAAVYAASHRNGKTVAVKWLHAELTIDANVRARFLREGYIANKVGHPGAVSVLDDEESDEGALLLVMELLEGETLDARFRRCGGSLPATEVLLIFFQVLDVLAAAHTNGIVHRDLKPENLFLTREGAVKVLDFGIARLREISGKSGATGSHSSLGTPSFMPPEQARGRWQEVDPRTDLWAAGATMFRLITGRHVHEAPTVNEQLLAAMTQPAPALKSLSPLVPDAVARVVDRALAFEKAQRWADAREMQLAVREAYREITGEPIANAARLVAGESIAEDTIGPISETLAATSAPERTTNPSRAKTHEDTTQADGRTKRRRTMVLAIAAACVILAVPIVRFASVASVQETRVDSGLATIAPSALEIASVAASAPASASASASAFASASASASAAEPLPLLAPHMAAPHPHPSPHASSAAVAPPSPPSAAPVAPSPTPPTAAPARSAPATNDDPLDRRR